MTASEAQNWMNGYRACRLCGRLCGVDRLAGALGFCGESSQLRIATASIHKGEEPPLVGRGGSGTIFLTGCTLHCSFCQNWQISRSGMGRTVSQDEFVGICLALQHAGAENINLVTGSHAAPALGVALDAALAAGLDIPVLWNSSAYESTEAIDAVAPWVDVWLPDLKTLDTGISQRYFHATDYPELARAAILRMARLRPLRWGPSRHDPHGEPLMLHSGVIVRHLLLPDQLDSTRAVLQWFVDNLKGEALISLMTQYTPVSGDAATVALPSGRFVSEQEYKTVLQLLEEFGLEDGFYQELIAGDDWLPDFRRINPFSSELSVPIWHWTEGFMDVPLNK